MKEHLRQLAFTAGNDLARTCLVREYLQARILESLQEQTGWDGPRLMEANWRKELKSRIESLDWEKARADVKPFLEREQDLDLVRKEVLIQLLV